MINNELDNLVEEIYTLTKIPKDEIKQKLLLESNDGGKVGQQEFLQLGGTPHVYDEKMERFYRESTSFIFETLVSFYRPGKQQVLERTLEYLEDYLKRNHNYILKKEDLKILMLGDGVGSDSIFLYKNGYKPVYFDFPESKTYDFAMKRFSLHKYEISTINSLELIRSNFYDVIICFEVLEHVEKPLEIIDNMYQYLKDHGISIITESFGAISPSYPTHLYSSVKYRCQTPFLFNAYKLKLITNPKLYPAVYQKQAKITLKDSLSLYLNKDLFKVGIKYILTNKFRH